MSRTAQTKVLTALAVKKFSQSLDEGDLHDGGGLYLRKRKSSCWWYVRMISPATNKQTWIKLFPSDPSGYYPRKSLDQARSAAEVVWSQKSAGLDPRLERRATLNRQLSEAAEHEAQRIKEEKARLTLKQLFKKWQEVELTPIYVDGEKRSGRKDGGALVELQLNKHVFQILGERQAVSVAQGDVMEVLDKIKMAGKNRSANTVLSHLKQMFRFAVVRELVAKDPTVALSKLRHAGGKDVERERALAHDEIKLLAKLSRSARLSSRTVAALWIMLGTLCRIAELTNARWSDVDLENAIWSIPPTNSKNRKRHTVHLSKFVVQWFEFLAMTREQSEWVLPGRKLSKPLGSKTINKQVHDRQVLGRSPLKGRTSLSTSLLLPNGQWTPHDLRRTGATVMSQLDVPTDIIHLCQNHTPQDKLARIYIRDPRMPQRKEAFEALGAKLASITRDTIDFPQVIPSMTSLGKLSYGVHDPLQSGQKPTLNH